MKKTSKRVFSVLLALLMLLSAAPLTALELYLPATRALVPTAKASDYLTSGYCGDTSDGKDGTDIYWEIDENGVLTLTGTGPMGSAPNQSDNRVTKLIVGEGITAIVNQAFSDCQNLVEVELPDTITEIGYKTFYNDVSLTTVTANSITTVGRSAFEKCGSLNVFPFETVVTVMTNAFADSGITTCNLQSVQTIEEKAFSHCVKMTELFIGSYASTLGSSAFYNCSRLVSVTFADREVSLFGMILYAGLNTIETNAFLNCGQLTQLSFPRSLRTIKRQAFAQTGMQAFIIPDNCTTIEEGALNNSGALSYIYIGKSLSTFGTQILPALETVEVSPDNTNFAGFDGVLYDKAFTKILLCPVRDTLNLPDTFAEYETNFMRDFSFLKYVSVSDDSENYSVHNGILYTKDGTELIGVPPKFPGNFELIDGVRRICSYAFISVYSLQEIVLPDSIEYIGDSAFYGCFYLNSVQMPAHLKTIDKNAFMLCIGLNTYSLPSELEYIGDAAFKQTALHGDFILPDSCETLGSAVLESTGITYLYIGKSLSSIGGNNDYRNSLSEVAVSPENETFASFDGVLYKKDFSKILLIPQKESIMLPSAFPWQEVLGREPDNFLMHYDTIKTVQVEEGNTAYCAIDGLLYSADGTVLALCPGGREGDVHIADCATSIGDYAFSYCQKIKDIYIPGNVEVVNGIFYSSAQHVYMEEGIKKVNCGFSFCGFKELILPSTVEYFAAINNSAIETIEYSSSLKTTSFSDSYNQVYKNVKSITAPNRYMTISGIGRVTPADDSSVIHAYCGSPAHDMAIKRLFKFESLGHTWLDWYVYEPATYEHDGIERRDCAYCDGYEERVIPKLQPDTYTATFVADGTVVASVDFQKGATSVIEPAVPARDRYTGRWEDYTLNDEDITVNAVYTLIQSGDVSEIETESSVTLYEEKDNVLFRLKAWSDAKTVKSVVSQSIPLDIVLVVDQSGSMDDTLGGSVKKVDALKDAANSFIESVAANAEMTGADHRIAIAGFGLAGNYTGYLKNENTELLTSPRGILGYADITPADYAGALVSIREKQTLLDAVASIEARGATAADLGLEMAKGVFSNTDSTGRERVVVFMTDGEPTYTNGFQTSVANSAVYNAKLLKNAYGALVYSVGVFGTAESGSRNVQAFMNAVSSNYPKAESYTKLGTQVSDAFFITASHTDALTGIFRTITTESLSHTAPFENVTLIKTLSPYVTLSAPQEEALRVDVMRKYGVSNDQISVSVDEQGRTSIRIDGLAPYEVTDEDGNVTYEVAVEFFASLNENASAADTYTVDTDDSGIMLNGAIGYEAVFGTGEITLTTGKNRYIFTINGEVYEITEGGNISACVPETDFAPDWQFSGWNLTGVQSANGVIVDASLIKAPRTVIWHTDTEDVQQIYVQGDILTPPAVADRSDGSVFLSWNRSLPTVMPDSDLEFTAVYGPHIHRYEAELTVRATCTADGLLTYTCSCGDFYDETVPALGHNYEALTASTDNDDSRCTFVCTNCGDRYEYALSYQVTSASNHRGRLLYEFNLTNDTLETGFQPDGSVEVRVPLSDFQSTARNVYVYRNIDGEWDAVPARLENGYLVITADHFTPYDVRFVFSCNETGEHDWGEGTVTKDPTCSEEGVRHFVCSFCEDEKDEPIGLDENNHADYGTEVVNVVAVTCYSDGYTGDTVCARCRVVLSRGTTVSKNTVPHAWDEGTVTLKPTCKTTGTMLYRCTVKSCGATKEETINVDPDAHVYNVTVTEPTCTEGGYTAYACTLCTYSYTEDQTGPLGHTFAIRVTPATCTSGGITTYSCTRCPYSYTEDPTPRTDHVDNDRDGWCDYGCGTAMVIPGEGGQGQSDSGEKCPLCGETHTGFLGRIIGFFHRIAYFFKHLFG